MRADGGGGLCPRALIFGGVVWGAGLLFLVVCIQKMISFAILVLSVEQNLLRNNLSNSYFSCCSFFWQECLSEMFFVNFCLLSFKHLSTCSMLFHALTSCALFLDIFADVGGQSVWFLLLLFLWIKIGQKHVCGKSKNSAAKIHFPLFSSNPKVRTNSISVLCVLCFC